MSHLYGALKRMLKFPSLTLLSQDERVIERSKSLVAWYYTFLLIQAFIFLSSNFLNRPGFDPLWPLAWSKVFSLGSSEVLYVVLAFFVGVAFLTIFLYPYRIFRILAFIAIWQAHAFESSFGSINHQMYVWVYTSAIFIFLPDIWRTAQVNKDAARKFLLGIWFAQASVMVGYTMSGITKFTDAWKQFSAGEIHSLAIDGLAYHVAYWVPQLQNEAVLAPLIIAYPIVGWLPFVAVHFLQLFALWAMVRLSLQKIWALALIASHFAIYTAMGIWFLPTMLVVIVLFFHSPFAKPYRSMRAFAHDLPVVGQIIDILEAWRRKSTQPHSPSAL